MSWQGVFGHDEIAEAFRRSATRGRLPGSYLFVGPEGIGKRTFALKLAQAVLCENYSSDLEPCQNCSQCHQVESLTHPDLELIGVPEDGKKIPIKVFAGDQEHRGREGFCHWLSLRPYAARVKVGIINDADALSEESANCLLKTLEEPPPRSLLILIGTSPDRQLPTIRSRCQIIRFEPLSDQILADLLLRLEVTSDRVEAAQLAAAAAGSVIRAMQHADPQWRQFRTDFVQELARPRMHCFDAAVVCTTYVEAAGKDANVRRRRAGHTVRLAIEFYRAKLRSQLGLDCSRVLPDEEFQIPRVGHGDIESQALDSQPLDIETTAACVSRCLATQQQIERNANLSNVIEGWMHDLACLAQGQVTRSLAETYV